MKLFGLVIFALCVNFLAASETYKAAVLHVDKEISNKDLASFVYEAGNTNADILVLPTPELAAVLDNYDETINSLSKAAKDASLYVVAHMYEKARCQKNVEIVRSNLVFNREGSIISAYRKPMSNLANCSSIPSELVTFTTDFGVTFGLLMEEDIILHKPEYMKGLKNFVMTDSGNDRSFLSANHFPSAWTFVNNVNLISSSGNYIGKSGIKTGSGRFVTADLGKNGGSEDSSVLMANPSKVPIEDLSQYSIKHLDLAASTHGVKETVCHGSFCCEFYVKTGATDLTSQVSYSLAVFDGVRSLTTQHNIGVQDCAIIACVDEMICEKSSINNSNISFEKISIAANFTKQNIQYPTVHTTSVLPAEKLKFETNTNSISTQVTLELLDNQNVMKLGIFGRDFSRDYEKFSMQRDNSDSTYDIYDLIFNEDVQEFFDYVWIRLRILIVVVSIYVLEMM